MEVQKNPSTAYVDTCRRLFRHALSALAPFWSQLQMCSPQNSRVKKRRMQKGMASCTRVERTERGREEVL